MLSGWSVLLPLCLTNSIISRADLPGNACHRQATKPATNGAENDVPMSLMMVPRPDNKAVGLPKATTSGFTRPSDRSEEHTSELQSRQYLVCRLLLEKKKTASHFGRRVISRPEQSPGARPTAAVAHPLGPSRDTQHQPTNYSNANKANTGISLSTTHL